MAKAGSRDGFEQRVDGDDLPVVAEAVEQNLRWTRRHEAVSIGVVERRRLRGTSRRRVETSSRSPGSQRKRDGDETIVRMLDDEAEQFRQNHFSHNLRRLGRRLQKAR